jgi:hypothetical protein
MTRCGLLFEASGSYAQVPPGREVDMARSLMERRREAHGFVLRSDWHELAAIRMALA